MSKEQPKKITNIPPLGDVVAGSSNNSTSESSPKTTRKSPSTQGQKSPADAAASKKKVTVRTDAQTSLEKARNAVETFAAVNAAQAHELGVQLADAEAAFPLAMMSAYQARKAENQAAGLDAATFLDGLTDQVTALRETSVTITLPPTAGGRTLIEGTNS